MAMIVNKSLVCIVPNKFLIKSIKQSLNVWSKSLIKTLNIIENQGLRSGTYENSKTQNKNFNEVREIEMNSNMDQSCLSL